MKIKKYIDFINEDVQTLGTRVESLYDGDDYVKNIVNRFLGEIPSDVRLSNAVNLLSEDEQDEMKSLLDDYESNGIQDKEPIVAFSTDIEPLTESEITPGGKGAFTSFLKVMTALGQKDVAPDMENCPEDFILFYPSIMMETKVVKAVLGRYRSLARFVEDVDYTQNELRLYFGLRCDGDVEYGAVAEERSRFGGFRLTQSVIKWINTLELKSLFSFKKELVNLNQKDVLTLGDIKTDMSTYDPGYSEGTMCPTLTDRVISFGFKGVGRWDNGILDEGELQNLKSNFVAWMMPRKWSQKVLISVKASSYWLYIHLKLK